ncbi:MAG TPA: SGNH/GDSL hydrolase family protein [Planctomycetota bacterium]|nr:SGNH/GDSL hydrolase family protein [Planctomycetota bacterium]
MKPLATLLLFLLASAIAAAAPAWVEPMKNVHEKFTGTHGTFAQFGDSITVTMAFWSPLQYDRKNATPEMDAAFKRVKDYMKPDCWQKWKGPNYGSEGGMTIRWANDNIDKWLKKLNPEVALIMFGTNDLRQLKADEYEQKTRAVIQKCLDNGTIVILSTIPPRSGMLDQSKEFADIARKIAKELNLPFCDYFGECLKRRPDDWDGTQEKFKDRKGYDVLTLISADGVHPSTAKEFQGNYSEEGLKTSGYTLRNYVVLMSYAEVIEKALGNAK